MKPGSNEYGFQGLEALILLAFGSILDGTCELGTKVARAELYKALSRDGRMEDYDRSMDDIPFREELYYQYGIKKKTEQVAQ